MSAPPRPITHAERSLLNALLPEWNLARDGSAIRRYFHCRDFREAMEFVNGVATAAERCDHFPEWSNIGDRVEIILTTHAIQGLSDRDLKLASSIDAVAPVSIGIRPTAALDDFERR